MAERRWTKPQRDAIYARGGSLLVSAAAGSGKTAVLVERALQLICDPRSPVDADHLLIVTFSNAAAAEMKQRISARLSSMIRENPADLYLQRQQSLLAGAQISTIHSFCLELIRQNFQNLSLSPDFMITDQQELENMRSDCAREAVEFFYREDENGSFSALVELLSAGRDDRRLMETILRIYDFSRSHPFYESWLNSKLAMYDPSIPVQETVWGKSLLQYATDSLEYCVQTHSSAIELLHGDEKLEKAYLPVFQSDLAQMQECLESAAAGKWDETVRRLQTFSFLRLGSVRGEDACKQRAKAIRDRNKGLIQDLGEKYLNATGEDFAGDIADLRPKIQVLFRLVKDFARRLDKAKAEKRRLDFSDLEHFALQLLVEKSKDGYTRTGRAREIADQYDFILVDEYQDTNEVQDLIFTSISREQDNLFMVGDVKQSIYSFRQAMPEIFMKKKKLFNHYDGVNYPASIVLDTNFRSRREVTESVNYLFRQLMSEEMGEIDYEDEESLKCGAEYPPYGQAFPELLVVDLSEYAGSEVPAQLEAREIARKIGAMLSDGYQVTGEEGMRPLVLSDICILLRSPKGKAGIYVKELAANGITAWAENSDGYLQTREISAMVSFLKALDNPLLDIELVASLMSPFFGFNSDEIAEIRVLRRGEAFYLALQQAARNGMEKAATFLELFHQMRILSARMSADRLLLQIYDRTDAAAVAQVMPLGASRVANLMLLVEYAASYHQLGYKGLGGFVSFLNRMEERGGDLSPANSLGDGANVVRIMSIHRSKGLEFPVVFLADTGKAFNKTDLRQNALLHSRYGFACIRRDHRIIKQYSTIPMQAIRMEMERSMVSEELRVLYVALTRAREKLIITCAPKGAISKKLSNWNCELIHGKIPSFLVGQGTCYMQWVMMSLLHHPSASALREAGNCDKQDLAEDGNRWGVEFIHPGQESVVSEERKTAPKAGPDPALKERILHRAGFVYPYLAQTEIPAKLGVSAVAKEEQAVAHRFASRPKFMQKTVLTPAEKGNALHKFMQFADYASARQSLAEEITRLGSLAYLSKAEVQSLDQKKLFQFFSSSLASRIFASKQVYRELKFTAECGKDLLGDYIQGMDEHSKIVLQGVADCAFVEDGEAVIVDYKTDHVQSAGELLERYRIQMEFYQAILEESLGVPVKECIIYSFALSTAIPVKNRKQSVSSLYK